MFCLSCLFLCYGGKENNDLFHQDKQHPHSLLVHLIQRKFHSDSFFPKRLLFGTPERMLPPIMITLISQNGESINIYPTCPYNIQFLLLHCPLPAISLSNLLPEVAIVLSELFKKSKMKHECWRGISIFSPFLLWKNLK